MNDLSQEKKVKIYKASKVLQEKAGTGNVSEQKIREAEKIIEDNTVNFVPMANDYLDDLGKTVKHARQDDKKPDDILRGMTLPIMQLKATGSIFGYKLVGDLATMVLNFLENVKTVDEDVLSIVEALHQMLTVILREQMVNDGGFTGEKMKKELFSVCQRYMKKNYKD